MTPLTKDHLRSKAGCEEIARQYSGLSLREIGRRLGCHHTHVARQFHRFLGQQPAPEDLSEEAAREMLSTLGYAVLKRNPPSTAPENREFFAEGEEVFATLSCTHLGDRYQQMTALHTAYRLIAQEGIKTVFHCGDLLAGIKVYPGQENDLHVHGYTAQINYAAQVYPRVEGITTYWILGNHDYSFYKHGGGNPGEDLALRRPDLQYLGAFGAFYDFHGFRIYVYHGKGGLVVGRTTKIQKVFDGIAPSKVPDVLLAGHWHVTGDVPEYRGGLLIQVPSFQGQTEFLRRSGFEGQVGFFIIRLRRPPEPGLSKIAGITWQWIPLPLKENDF